MHRGSQLITLLDVEHPLAKAIGRGVHQVPGPLLDQKSGQRHQRVDSPFEADLGAVSVGHQSVPTLLCALLFGIDQRPTDAVVVDAAVQYLLIADADDLDDLARFGRGPRSSRSRTSTFWCAGDHSVNDSRSKRTAMISSDVASMTTSPGLSDSHAEPDCQSGGRRNYLPFLTLSTCLRRPSVADSKPPFIARLSTKPGIGTAGSTVISNRTFVLSPSGVSMYDAFCVLS